MTVDQPDVPLEPGRVTNPPDNARADDVGQVTRPDEAVDGGAAVDDEGGHDPADGLGRS